MSGRSAAAWLLEPLNTLSPKLRAALVLALTAIVTVVSVLLLRHMENPFLIPDANQYLYLAERRMDMVPQPFASRPLAPLLARALAAVLHTSLQRGFFVVGLCALAFTLLVTFGLATRSAAPRWIVLAIAIVPFWPLLLHGYALPDIWYAAMICCLLLCLAAKRPTLAALTFFPLMLSRESTSLALVCLLLVGWRSLRLRGCVLAVAASVAGSLVVRRLSVGTLGNREHLPTVVYLAAKVPWNLMRTVGIDPWSNVYPYLCGSPAWQRAVAIGPVRALGVCRVSPIFPVQAIFALLSILGLFPPLLVVLWRGRAPIGRQDLLTRFCLLYGGVSLVLAPMLGTAFQRLFGYAWPLFLIALPRLFPARAMVGSELRGWSRELVAVGVFLVLQIAMAAAGMLPSRPPVSIAVDVLEVLGIALLVNPVGAFLHFSWVPETALQRGKINSGKTPE